MIPLHLKLSGFLSYREPVEVDFTGFDLACISGSNGAGKSSLLDAVTWALFGEARKRDEALINAHRLVKAAEVALTFAYEGNTYRVIRVLPRGKSTVLEFQILDDGQVTISAGSSSGTWRPLTERTLRDTQARIEQVLRLDYDTFVNASFFLQGQADQFAQQKPSRRKEILGGILGLEVWEEYKDRTAGRRKAIERDLVSLTGRLQEIEAELAEEEPRRRKLAELEAQLDEMSAGRKAQEAALKSLKEAAVSQVAAEKARLEEERRSLKGQEESIQTQAQALAELTTRQEAAGKALLETEGRISERQELESQRNAGSSQSAELKAENALLKAAMDELKVRIGQLESAEGARCPLCGQELSEGHRQSTLETLHAEGKEKGDRYRANKASLDDLTQRLADAESQIARLAGAERERLAASNSITQMAGRIESITEAARNWETGGAKRLQELETLLAGERYAAETRQPVASLEEAERALLDLKERENRLNQEVGAARQKVSVLDDLRQRKAGLELEADAQRRQVGAHKQLERAFGRDGVPALLIEQALPEIEAHANELLDRLSDGSMSVRFVTQAAYKDKNRADLRETLDIQISDGSGSRDYETFSGGEAFRVNFAIRLALSRLLSHRKGARLQTLVIDEGFGSQDVQGRQRLIEAINAVRGDFARILVITHMDELKDAFPTRIEVTKGPKGSLVSVI